MVAAAVVVTVAVAEMAVFEVAPANFAAVVEGAAEVPKRFPDFYSQ